MLSAYFPSFSWTAIKYFFISFSLVIILQYYLENQYADLQYHIFCLFEVWFGHVIRFWEAADSTGDELFSYLCPFRLPALWNVNMVVGSPGHHLDHEQSWEQNNKAQKCKGWGLWNHQKSRGLTTSSILLNTILLWAIYCQTNSNTCLLGKVIQLVFFYSLSWEIILPRRNLLAELKWKVFNPSPGLFLPHRIDSMEAEGSPFLAVLEKPETTETFFLFFRYQGFCIITTLRKVSQMLY